MNNGIIVKEAKHSGFCPGTKNAVKKLYEEIEKNKSEKKIYLLGKLIHNNNFIDDLKKKGIIVIDDDVLNTFINSSDSDFIKENLKNFIEENSIVIIRAHGIPKKVSDVLCEMNVTAVDTTCVCVKKIHSIVEENTDGKSLLFITGDDNHPEVSGTKSYSKGNVVITNDIMTSIKNKNTDINSATSVILVSQTTHNKDDFTKNKEYLENTFGSTKKLKIFDTICSVTESRQREVGHLSKDVDIMIVVGGFNSSNTKKLYDISVSNCEHTYRIETSEQLPLYKLTELIKIQMQKKGAVKVGIAAGASTPDSIIKEVKQIMADVQKPITGENELSFEEMLNQSFVTLNRGEKVKGIISSVLANELHVDLGIKQTGILTFDEITDDSSFKLEENFKVGDEIEVQILKISDQEGTAMLSKKRIDATKNWVNIIQYKEDGTVVDGKIISVVNGGLIALIEGIKVFVPASQANVSKSVELQTLVGSKIRAKIIDVDEQKHRAIASVRQAYYEERKELEAKLWETIAVGNKYTGTIKSITNYGAFVDIGGADGMVHITELTWSRIKHPSEVIKIGDKVDVYIKEIDTEKRRIALGYKKEEDNPWIKFLKTKKVDDVVDVKIMSLMPFGAFAEIEPGVDGLIHISQISDRKIAKPADELSLGQVCKAKITAIDEQNKKISLSMRALIEKAESEVSEKEVEKLSEKLSSTEAKPETEITKSDETEAI